MAFIDWPFLDGFKIAGFSTRLADRRIVTETAAGEPLGMGGQPAGGARALAATQRLTVGELAQAQTFWSVTLAEGTLPFRIRDPQFDGTGMGDEILRQCLDEAGRAVLMRSYWLMRFALGSPPPEEQPTRAGVWTWGMQMKRLA